MLDHVTPFFALVAFFLVLLPLAWHIRSRNAGTISLSIWLLLGNLDTFINAMVWWSSTANLAPGYCELTVPASNLVIARKLENIASTRQVRTSAADQKRSLLIDLLICVGVPFIYGGLMIINQSNRYAIIEEAGCWPMLVSSWVWVLLVAAPVVIVCLCSTIYSALAFRWFWIRRRQFQAVLASSASTINKARYVRLLALTAADMLVFFPIYMGTVSKQMKDAITLPYGSWSIVHSDFDQINQYPASVVMMESSFKRNLILSRLVCPVSAYIFFAMFGLGFEVRQGYKQAFKKAAVFCKLRRESKATPQHIVADIEVVTFRSRDTFCDDVSPRSEKFGKTFGKTLEE
ncbi:related to pheromone receptor a2 [Sporisorium reilianum f. sp. reilianum]|uniref:Related to pheromone receptor a2 n=1 Tax=Sporisorium reilianum f. sp. reilianum TaxID=72559 RepID=A0A2N8UML5_9BASI|nr:related to pheromone receptor a2 [Sporisorium reilianum f. sp. reilianum]DBA11504.1 TPA_inf: STE3 [Sporisorium reilianum f. sp. reilianum]